MILHRNVSMRSCDICQRGIAREMSRDKEKIEVHHVVNNTAKMQKMIQRLVKQETE